MDFITFVCNVNEWNLVNSNRYLMSRYFSYTTGNKLVLRFFLSFKVDLLWTDDHFFSWSYERSIKLLNNTHSHLEAFIENVGKLQEVDL